MTDNPDEKRYGPIVVFLLVLAMLAWAVALHRLGGK